MALSLKETMLLEKVRAWARMHPKRELRMAIIDDPDTYPRRMASFTWFEPHGFIEFAPIENAVEEFFREINR